MASLRTAQPADFPTVERLHAEQNQRDGTDYPIPQWFDIYGRLMPNIALALVVEQDGEVLQGIWFECRTVEMMVAGCDPEATAIARREIDSTAYLLRNLGYTGICCLVPDVVLGSIEKPLRRAGFTRNDHLTHFFREVGGGI